MLTISERTVGNHVSGLLGKLEFSNRIELATYAVKNHIRSICRAGGKWRYDLSPTLRRFKLGHPQMRAPS